MGDMKFLPRSFLPVATIAALLACSGCGKSRPPEPLSTARAPAELTQAFAKAKPEVKEVMRQAIAALEAQHLTEASAWLLQLSSLPDLDAPQREVVARATIGLNQALQAAQASGDAQAAEHLRRLQQSR
jgi:hypothetical protein